MKTAEALNPFFRRILAARGVQSIDEIDYRLQNIIPLESIRNLSSAADLLTDLIKRNETILVFGDYDADGATSTAVCMRAFSLMGYGHVNYLMPDRIADGYGLSLSVAGGERAHAGVVLRLDPARGVVPHAGTARPLAGIRLV